MKESLRSKLEDIVASHAARQLDYGFIRTAVLYGFGVENISDLKLLDKFYSYFYKEIDGEDDSKFKDIYIEAKLEFDIHSELESSK